MTDKHLQSHSVPASNYLAALRDCGIDHVVTVPDWVQLAVHARLESGLEDGISLINTCNENQAVTIAAGLRLGGKNPVVLVQNQGLYNCINTLRAICIDAKIPTLLIVGQFGQEYAKLGQPSSASERSMVRLMEPLLEALEIPVHQLDTAENLPCIKKAWLQAEAEGGAVVVLVSAPLAWS